MLQIVAVSVVAYLLRRSCSPALRWAQAARRRPATNAPPLRVFGDPRRTEALQAIASRWQRFGPVTMIAAPDVVAGTVDPGDVLRFMSGSIDAGF